MTEPVKVRDASFIDDFCELCKYSKIGSTELMIYLIGVEVLERLDKLVQPAGETNEKVPKPSKANKD